MSEELGTISELTAEARAIYFWIISMTWEGAFVTSISAGAPSVAIEYMSPPPPLNFTVPLRWRTTWDMNMTEQEAKIITVIMEISGVMMDRWFDVMAQLAQMGVSVEDVLGGIGRANADLSQALVKLRDEYGYKGPFIETPPTPVPGRA